MNLNATDRTLIQIIAFLAIGALFLALMMAVALRTRDLSVWDCEDTGVNQYECRLR